MSQTLKQIADANPITAVAGSDLFYLSRSPYTSGLDRGITATNLFSSPEAIGSVAPSTGTFTSIQTLQTAANTTLFQAYDVDGAAYKTFATLISANTPSLAFTRPSGTILTWDGGTIGSTAPAAGFFTDLQANRIGNVSPGSGTFSNLSWYIRQSLISTNDVVDPDTDLCTSFLVDTASVIISAETYNNYIQGFQFEIKNISAGNINFTPFAGDTIEGNSTLVILANQAIRIVKSLTANSWVIYSSYATGGGGTGYLLAANNLSDVASAATSRTNLGLGTIATQNSNNVTITGGSINGTNVGNGVGGAAIGSFSYLKYPVRLESVNTGRTIDPTEPNYYFEVSNSGVVISAQTYANYGVGFQFGIKNNSNGNIFFTPFAGDNIDGAATLPLLPGQSYFISKSLNSGKWIALANYDLPSTTTSSFQVINSSTNISPNKTYYCTNGSYSVIDLPLLDTFAPGDTVRIIGGYEDDPSVGLFSIETPEGSVIYWQTLETTFTNPDNQGFIVSLQSGQVIELMFVSLGVFVVINSVGDNFVVI